MNLEEVLGFSTPPARTRVVVAMSGGVDSSVCAALLAEAGYDVVGVTLQLYDHGMALAKKGACCAGQDIYDASKVAEQLGFPHYVLDYESQFKQGVIEDFADSYLKGETPIPCIRCNQSVKFKDLLEVAKSLKAQALITGHYVQRKKGALETELHQGHDPKKDQSYFLFSTTQDQLNFLRFPLGNLTKSQTRDHAARFGLSVAEKPDSQDICFVPGGNYAQLVKKLRPESLRPGSIVHVNGAVVGHHEGIIHFTIGQRKGTGVGGSKEPLYVVALNPERCEVVVGPKSALGTKEIILQNVNWLSPSLKEQAIGPQGLSCQVKIRSSSTPLKAKIHLEPQAHARVIFDELEYGVAPGQACVAYDNTRLLGGGWIAKSA